MSIHIGAKKGEIAPGILLPGDPLRAKYIADTFFEDPVCFNNVRGMLGFTGKYKGKRVSVMGTGMGIPSHAIYVTELIKDYDVQTLIRVGTCGAFQADLKIGDLILAMTSSTDSNINKLVFSGMDFAPTANFELLQKAYQAAQHRNLTMNVGGIISMDVFYKEGPEWWKIWADYGTLAVEMETTALYTLAAKYKVSALSILTVSDNLITHEYATAEQREKNFPNMAEIALEILP